ncbi:plantaricin C family lantibiotic [Microbacterium sp.]|uniref:plantaricin C family lantibiotic n=1 Tax=Microbacterium sp. TaxID=51671 RepID=UPI00333EF8BC
MSAFDVTVFEEIADQDFDAVASGGTITITPATPLISATLGNHGYVCTATKECMPNCN